MRESGLIFHHHRKNDLEIRSKTERKLLAASKSLDFKWMKQEDERIRVLKHKFSSDIYGNQ